MITAARRAAFDALSEIELRGAYSDYVLNSKRMAALEERDRHMVTEIVYGVERWRGLLDAVLGSASARPWGRVDTAIRITLRMALYQLWRMDRIPEHAAVGESVELAKVRVGRSAAGFVNGVLRNLLRSAPWTLPDFPMEFPPHVRTSTPEWLWDRWERRWGEERAAAFCLSLNEVPPKAYWVPAPAATTKRTPSARVPGAYIAGSGEPVSSPMHLQDEASQLIPHLLGDIRGWIVWDACAAPGGKSALLISAAGADGRVISSDLRPGRASRMAKMLARIFSSAPAVVVADARELPPFAAPFGAVLADVPCSGLGTLRRNPEIKWRFSPSEFDRLAHVQGEILHSVASVVRPGGYLLYSTCSTEPEEDECVVDRFLRQHPEFRTVRPVSPPGIEDLLDERGMVRTFPSEHRWDGFFGALMARRS